MIAPSRLRSSNFLAPSNEFAAGLLHSCIHYHSSEQKKLEQTIDQSPGPSILQTHSFTTVSAARVTAPPTSHTSGLPLPNFPRSALPTLRDTDDYSCRSGDPRPSRGRVVRRHRRSTYRLTTPQLCPPVEHRSPRWRSSKSSCARSSVTAFVYGFCQRQVAQ